MHLNGTKRDPTPCEHEEPLEAADDADAAAEDDLDLDLEEADDGERLKEGFTGQER